MLPVSVTLATAYYYSRWKPLKSLAISGDWAADCPNRVTDIQRWNSPQGREVWAVRPGPSFITTWKERPSELESFQRVTHSVMQVDKSQMAQTKWTLVTDGGRFCAVCRWLFSPSAGTAGKTNTDVLEHLSGAGLSLMCHPWAETFITDCLVDYFLLRDFVKKKKGLCVQVSLCCNLDGNRIHFFYIKKNKAQDPKKCHGCKWNAAYKEKWNN